MRKRTDGTCYVVDVVIDHMLDDAHTLDGRTVEVKRAIPRGEKSAMGGPRLVTVGCVSSEAKSEGEGEEEDTIKLSRDHQCNKKRSSFANPQKRRRLPSCIRDVRRLRLHA